ncbi:uncharacterized protein PHACADRAFT_202943 [Phanerochaete carnosa HHB-10118-sp]|uniref:Uncharacterized protein n=1 Tax=Phanerochaete carnosa (strain HHB-10118-sp) TaxID=650164 RepID=K5VP61_PHACS|nr:uncharacterized protein PHACADRAFT_202943 [Phanerochaete carnosa HHB-10118-sp]EKM48339.1 hypothetical protein PHACADRAFT_202943 [Phanerochaete carnosa HHB-10118-sp]
MRLHRRRLVAASRFLGNSRTPINNGLLISVGPATSYNMTHRLPATSESDRQRTSSLLPKDLPDRPRAFKRLADERHPRLRRALPEAVFDQLSREREAGAPHQYTTSELRAVVRHVSTLPPPSTALPTIDWDAVEQAKLAAHDDRQHFQAQRDQARARQNAHASASSSRSLADRLTAAPTYTPIAPKPVTIDFSRYTAADLARIFAPKFAATLKRFNVLESLDCPDVLTDDINAVFKLRDRLAHLDRTLKDVSRVISIEEWNRWDSGLKQIGGISFKGLRRNRVQIFKALRAVWVNGYFD